MRAFSGATYSMNTQSSEASRSRSIRSWMIDTAGRNAASVLPLAVPADMTSDVSPSPPRRDSIALIWIGRSVAHPCFDTHRLAPSDRREKACLDSSYISVISKYIPCFVDCRRGGYTFASRISTRFRFKHIQANIIMKLVRWADRERGKLISHAMGLKASNRHIPAETWHAVDELILILVSYFRISHGSKALNIA